MTMMQVILEIIFMALAQTHIYAHKCSIIYNDTTTRDLSHVQYWVWEWNKVPRSIGETADWLPNNATGSEQTRSNRPTISRRSPKDSGARIPGILMYWTNQREDPAVFTVDIDLLRLKTTDATLYSVCLLCAYVSNVPIRQFRCRFRVIYVLCMLLCTNVI